jgi:hypothetical protein
MRCWLCGVEPLDVEVYDVSTLESAQPIRQVIHARWPAGDHTHSEAPPTADELASEAYRLLNQRVS